MLRGVTVALAVLVSGCLAAMPPAPQYACVHENLGGTVDCNTFRAPPVAATQAPAGWKCIQTEETTGATFTLWRTPGQSGILVTPHAGNLTSTHAHAGFAYRKSLPPVGESYFQIGGGPFFVPLNGTVVKGDSFGVVSWNIEVTGPATNVTILERTYNTGLYALVRFEVGGGTYVADVIGNATVFMFGTTFYPRADTTIPTALGTVHIKVRHALGAGFGFRGQDPALDPLLAAAGCPPSLPG